MSEKYSFIDAEYENANADEAENAPTIVQMCHWLTVSKSGYYEWRSRPLSAAGKRRELLKLKVKAIFEANNAEYGYRRVHQALVRGGEDCCRELVRALMRELGLEPCQPKPCRRSLTEQDGQAGPIPDLVNRDFTAEKPGEKMVGDITYIETWQGWLYLATVIDCATRKIVGWEMDDNCKTPLIVSAVEMAARNLDLPEDAIFHSDRGSNYTSGDFAKALKRLRCASPSGAPGFATTTRWPRVSTGRLRTSSSTVPFTRPGKKPGTILRGGSSSAIIVLVSTRDSNIGLLRRSWTST